MRRIHTIHALRKASGGVGLSIVLLIASLYFIGREVWVAHVWENMPTHADALIRFFTYAFIHTDVSVQILLLLSVAALVWFTREIARVLTAGIPRYA